ncbi:Glycosyltransferase involved in cell wall bisynthesis [Gracilibacillus orientalis]|uniref:Glycosyltransferase involved in cell wall bisynthesis n=1 Tax=Gracilibacillus orientalis TaxID=334253 RepID=A0A1I4R0K9_9BACI|nr:glycosyltransferase family 1 protein [Gracilibacillus orientalis]SFM45829.1 Glycosyltransferase involved in cell wall bisynthesis [Gracilibacillus orientalis]
MNILIITETFLPSTDGVVTRLTNSIRYFLNNGHQVTVIAPDLGVSEFEGAKVIGLPARKLPFYRSKPFALPNHRVKKLLLECSPDIVHVVNPALLGASGVYYAKKINFPLIASYHTQVPKYAEYYHLSMLKGLLWWYFRKLHKKASLNLCTSHVVKEELEQQNFNDVHVWKRGVDNNLFHPDKSDPKVRDRLTNGMDDKKLLLYVGRLAPEKEIEKIRTVLEQSDQFVFAIVGDGPHRAPLEQHFQGTNTVFTGFMHGEELAKAYASADVFVFPSTTETLGLVLMEAMASGLPIVAADSGPTREQIEHDKHGLLYNPESVESFKKTVLRLEDEALRKYLGETAWKDIHQMGWDDQSRQALAFYQQVIESHNKDYDKKECS